MLSIFFLFSSQFSTRGRNFNNSKESRQNSGEVTTGSEIRLCTVASCSLLPQASSFTSLCAHFSPPCRVVEKFEMSSSKQSAQKSARDEQALRGKGTYCYRNWYLENFLLFCIRRSSKYTELHRSQHHHQRQRIRVHHQEACLIDKEVWGYSRLNSE